MRKIDIGIITEKVSQLCVQANLNLRKDVFSSLTSAYHKETNLKAKIILKAIIDNASIAKREKLAICQDTGLPLVFLEVGENIQFTGGDLNKAIQKGIEQGYRKASLRNSIILDPLNRKSSKFSPGVIHVDFVKGSRLKITVLPKGFGCENKSRIQMFNPSVSIKSIKEFIIDTVKSAGPDACPPYVVGVGIGGSADYAMLLANKALLRKIRNLSSLRLQRMCTLERELLTAINKLNIGPMGLGGRTTALAVNIQTYPTHIAGLPVAVNISCHALRAAISVI
jgi:fumarate hydratase subunit alpha